ncbi:hypothetical protein R6V09_47365 [Streptomyces sp. W16]|uniref:hypothetical protein n=1 Tax=Streptomyces sp. W16 TaxID=3076631 RepID=UPI00295BC7FB|nr:hypothetical protein [Streptomyces sp. W16]MDV9177728.1 hypothetical protein [Streptomyces sp. W16]
MSGKGRGLGGAAVVVGLLGVGLALGSFVYAWNSYGSSTISSQSMSPTYRPGDRIVFEKVGGDEVVCCSGTGTDARITVNGKPLSEPYVDQGRMSTRAMSTACTRRTT